MGIPLNKPAQMLTAFGWSTKETVNNNLNDVAKDNPDLVV